jgi:hypothetical protein
MSIAPNEGTPECSNARSRGAEFSHSSIESMDMFGTDVLSVLTKLFVQGDDDGGLSLAAFVSPPC